MSTSAIQLPTSAVSRKERLLAFRDLAKPRIALVVGITVVLAAWISSRGEVQPATLCLACLGTGLLAASASVWNQWIERDTDARMPRTRTRPLPMGKVAGPAALSYGVVLLLLGACLLWWINPLTSGLGTLTWVLYVAAYTPLKRVSPWNTAVGAVAGAIPVLIGWATSRTELATADWLIFVIVFVWQFPHFMAISWIYKDEYAAAGLKMSAVTDATHWLLRMQAGLGAVALAPLTVWWSSLVTGRWPVPVVCGLLGLLFVGATGLFCWRLSLQWARAVFWLSLAYLLGMLVLCAGSIALGF